MHKARYFVDTIIVPNLRDLDREGDDERRTLNAVFALDAFFGILFRHLREVEHADVAGLSGDEAFRDEVAKGNPSYALIRDYAAAAKHGELTRGTKARLVRKPESMEMELLGCGTFQCGDALGADAAFFQTADGERIRAVDAVCETMREVLGRLERYGL